MFQVLHKIFFVYLETSSNELQIIWAYYTLTMGIFTTAALTWGPWFRSLIRCTTPIGQARDTPSTAPDGPIPVHQCCIEDDDRSVAMLFFGKYPCW